MSSNVVKLVPANRSIDEGRQADISDEAELTAVETLELVRTFSRIKDPSRRQFALECLKEISAEAAVD